MQCKCGSAVWDSLFDLLVYVRVGNCQFFLITIYKLCVALCMQLFTTFLCAEHIMSRTELKCGVSNFMSAVRACSNNVTVRTSS
jgi:hypothetical protein